MAPIDVVWLRFLPNDTNNTNYVIYSDYRLKRGEDALKYSILNEIINLNDVRSTLQILNLTYDDQSFVYQCQCNVYRRCVNANYVNANTTIVVFNHLNNIIHSTSNNLSSDRCLYGSLSMIQYLIVIISYFILNISLKLISLSLDKCKYWKYIF